MGTIASVWHGPPLDTAMDPFPARPVTCSDGINQHQDPGLDAETRAEAMKKVRHAVGRSVFYLDDLLTQALAAVKHFNNRPTDTDYYQQRANEILEEMLSHG